MSESGEKVFKIVCPCCRTTIWVDAAAAGILKTEKAAKAKQSLDDLLLKEKKKVEGMATKFEATAALERQKKQKAEEMFKKALDRKDEPEDPEAG
jgi:Tfp pilus assembly protein PilF